MNLSEIEIIHLGELTVVKIYLGSIEVWSTD